MRRAGEHAAARRLARAVVVAATAVALGMAAAPVAAAQGEAEKPAAEREARSYGEIVAGLDHRPGLLDLWLDREKGRVWAEIPPAEGADGLVGEYLYIEGLVTGLGSNPVGLDRGQIGPTRLVALRRVGGRLLVEQVNTRYLASSESTAERRAARQSFATSVLWAGPLVAPTDDGRALVDLTPFVLRDAHGVAVRLQETGQGKWKLDAERSAADLDACLAFPDNIELEGVLTWGGEEPGSHVRETAPSDDAITLVQHQSLVRLPPPGYEPRAHDPRAGSFAVSAMDFSARLDEPVERRWIVRHRLEKTDPSAASSPAVEPIVYHVDPGAPAAVRQALIDGASWWADAFAAAGFEDAYRVEVLPADAHPLDVRYNVIQWVHRSTRGWSYGGGVTDPRTGEMVKGHVTLGSLRVRQDRLIFEGLLGADASGTGAPDDPVELALARIRQLSAHEVGHTLGFDHNFAASTYGRASVMDYPAPLVELTPDGSLDVSRAYAVGMGEWDLHATRWAYSQFPPGSDEAAALDAIVRDGLDRGLLFLNDADARAPSTGHPRASLWDNGADPVAQLRTDMEVRRIALDRFGPDNVAPSRPLAHLEEVLATVYFRHRFQAAAAAKLLGGLDYRHGLRGDGQPMPRPVPADRQREALGALLDLLAPEALDLPEHVLAVLHPRPPEHGPNRELFPGAAGPAFDPLAAAAAAADLAVGLLLQPHRGQRLVDFHRRDPELPGLDEVLDELVERTFAAEPAEGRLGEIERVAQRVVVERLVRLAEDAAAAPEVRARASWRLERLLPELETGIGEGAAHRSDLRRTVRRHLERVRQGTPPEGAPAPPPGEPIGGGGPPELGSCSFGG